MIILNRGAKKVAREAGALLLARKDGEMRALLEPAVERFPTNGELHLLYATSLLTTDVAGVVTHARAATELERNDPLLLTRAATLLTEVGRLDLARPVVERAREVAGPAFRLSADLANLEGKLADQAGDVGVAEERLRAAVAEQPREYHFTYDLAAFLQRRGRSDEARQVIDTAACDTGGELPTALVELRRALGGGD